MLFLFLECFRAFLGSVHPPQPKPSPTPSAKPFANPFANTAAFLLAAQLKLYRILKLIWRLMMLLTRKFP